MRYSNIIQSGDYGQNREMTISDFKGYLRNGQLGGFFDDFVSNIEDSFSSGLEKTQNTLISNTINSLVNDPAVQAATEAELAEQALQTTAELHRQVVASAAEYWRKYKWGIIAGVTAASVAGGYLLFGRRRRRA